MVKRLLPLCVGNEAMEQGIWLVLFAPNTPQRYDRLELVALDVLPQV
jgi:hypothetical protein